MSTKSRTAYELVYNLRALGGVLLLALMLA